MCVCHVSHTGDHVCGEEPKQSEVEGGQAETIAENSGSSSSNSSSESSGCEQAAPDPSPSVPASVPTTVAAKRKIAAAKAKAKLNKVVQMNKQLKTDMQALKNNFR